ncbi:MAG: alginate lyase family protein [Armatimonadota bacterium]
MSGSVEQGRSPTPTLRSASTEAALGGKRPFEKVRITAQSAEPPCLLLTRMEVSRIQETVQRYSWARAVYDSILSRAADSKKRPLEVPDRFGTSANFYACPEHGVTLQTRSLTEHVCPVDGEVFTGPPYDGVAITKQHNALGEAVVDLGLAAILADDREAGAKARQVLLDYAQRYEHYPIHDLSGGQAISGGRLFAETLEEAAWLVDVAPAYDLLQGAGAVSADDCRQIEEHLLRPAAEIVRRHDNGTGNWQAWHNAALLACGVCLRDPDLVCQAVNGKSGFQFQMANSVRDDGFWWEGSWGYHYYSLGALVALVEMARRVGIDLYGNRRYRSLFEAPLRFAMPDGKLPPFHDSGVCDAFGRPSLYESAYAQWHDPQFAAVLSRSARNSRRALLDGAATVPVRETAPRLASSVFQDTGIALLRSGHGAHAQYLALDYGPHGYWHGHYDKLSFIYFAQGRILSLDPGSVPYGLPIHKGWYRQSIAHNTLAVDGASQAEATGKLLAFGALLGLQVAIADAGPVYPGVVLQRAIIMADDYVVCVDRVVSDEKHTYDWVLHNYGMLTSPAVTESVPEGLGSRAGYEYLSNLRRGEFGETWHALWTLPDAELAFVMLGAPGTVVYTGDGPGNPPAERVPFVLARRTDTRTIFVSAWRGGASEPPALKAVPVTRAGQPVANTDATAFEVSTGGRHDLFLCSFTPGRCRFGEYESDGRVAAVALSGPPRAWLVGGQLVHRDGKSVPLTGHAP